LGELHENYHHQGWRVDAEGDEAMNLISGQLVRVYPHGHQGRTAIGTVQIISRNQGMIAVSFAEKPPFVVGDGRVIHPREGIILYAMRVAVEGKPAGPWIELNGGHYVIEAV
jgi:hypothetical protein